MKTITIFPSHLHGCVSSVPSKSELHRQIIKAAFAPQKTKIHTKQLCDDILATLDGISSIGATYVYDRNTLTIIPIDRKQLPTDATINCRSSASTLRFLLPIVCALGINTYFIMSDELKKRPINQLCEELEHHRINIQRTSNKIYVSGKLENGEYVIPGDISSQFITGMMFALALLDKKSKLRITGKCVSRPYINLTKEILDAPYKEEVFINADWSCAAFFISAGVNVEGLNYDTQQGDKIFQDFITNEKNTFDVRDTPDLAPVLASYFARKNRISYITGCTQLIYKESNRVATIIRMLQSFGIKCKFSDEIITIYGSDSFHGCIVNAENDHRIVMASAILASFADSPTTIIDADAISKSYPNFFDHFIEAGGIVYGI